MRTLFVGAGATGGYFGGRLAEAGKDVTFLVRPARAAALAARGLRIQSPEGESVITARTVTAGAVDGPYDLIVLGVKSYGLEQAIADLEPAVGPETVIVPLLNGMRHLDALVAAFGAARVYGGVCMIASRLTGEGDVVQMTGMHSLTYGPLDGDDSRLAAVTEALSGAGFGSTATTGIVHQMWEKWLFLSGLGVATTLMRASVGEITSAPGGLDFAARVVDEASAIITAAGFPPAEAAVARLRNTLQAKEAQTTSSLFRDMVAGNPVEADAIVGDLVAHADRLGVPAPLYAAAYTNLCIYAGTRSVQRA